MESSTKDFPHNNELRPSFHRQLYAFLLKILKQRLRAPVSTLFTIFIPCLFILGMSISFWLTPTLLSPSVSYGASDPASIASCPMNLSTSYDYLFCTSTSSTLSLPFPTCTFPADDLTCVPNVGSGYDLCIPTVMYAGATGALYSMYYGSGAFAVNSMDHYLALSALATSITEKSAPTFFGRTGQASLSHYGSLLVASDNASLGKQFLSFCKSKSVMCGEIAHDDVVFPTLAEAEEYALSHSGTVWAVVYLPSSLFWTPDPSTTEAVISHIHNPINNTTKDSSSSSTTTRTGTASMFISATSANPTVSTSSATIPFTISMNYSATPWTFSHQVQHLFSQSEVGSAGYVLYWTSGFMTLQTFVQQFLLELYVQQASTATTTTTTATTSTATTTSSALGGPATFVGSTTEPLEGISTYLNQYGPAIIPMPTPSTEDNSFLDQWGYYLPFICALGALFPVSHLTALIVEEKPKGIRDLSRLMGMSQTAVFTSWYLFSLLLDIVVSLLASLFFKVGFFHQVSYGILFVLYFSFLQQNTALSLLLSSVFQNPRIASWCAALTIFVFVMPYYVFPPGMTDDARFGASIVPCVGFSNAMGMLVSYVTFAVNVDWTVAKQVGGSFTIQDAIAMMWTSFVGMMLLAWYLDHIIPSMSRGFREHPLFIFRPLVRWHNRRWGGGGKRDAFPPEAGWTRQGERRRRSHGEEEALHFSSCDEGSSSPSSPRRQGPSSPSVGAPLYDYDATMRGTCEGGHDVEVEGKQHMTEVHPLQHPYEHPQPPSSPFIEHYEERIDPQDANVPVVFEDVCVTYTTGSLLGFLYTFFTGAFRKGDFRVALRNMSFSLHRDEVSILLGPNGSGKSTIMNLATCMMRQTSGRIFIGGKERGRKSGGWGGGGGWNRNEEEGKHESTAGETRWSASIGYCPQKNIIWDDLTVEEHFRFYAHVKGVSEVEEEVQKLLSITGLTASRARRTGHLSGGEQRRVCVGIALVGNPLVVLMDEPTAGLDVKCRNDVYEVLQRVREGRSILISTHLLEEADRLGDRIFILHNGELCGEGSSMFLKTQTNAGYKLTCVMAGGEGGSTNNDGARLYADEEAIVGRLIAFVQEEGARDVYRHQERPPPPPPPLSTLGGEDVVEEGKKTGMEEKKTGEGLFFSSQGGGEGGVDAQEGEEVMIQQAIPPGCPLLGLQRRGREVSFLFPLSLFSSCGGGGGRRLVRRLEEEKKRLGLSSVGISLAGLDEAFQRTTMAQVGLSPDFGEVVAGGDKFDDDQHNGVAGGGGWGGCSRLSSPHLYESSSNNNRPYPTHYTAMDRAAEEAEGGGGEGRYPSLAAGKRKREEGGGEGREARDHPFSSPLYSPGEERSGCLRRGIALPPPTQDTLSSTSSHPVPCASYQGQVVPPSAGLLSSPPPSTPYCHHCPPPSPQEYPKEVSNRNTTNGCGGPREHFFRDFRAFFLKRLHSAKRDARLVFFQIALPVLFLGVALLVNLAQAPLQPGLTLNMEMYPDYTSNPSEVWITTSTQTPNPFQVTSAAAWGESAPLGEYYTTRVVLDSTNSADSTSTTTSSSFAGLPNDALLTLNEALLSTAFQHESNPRYIGLALAGHLSESVPTGSGGGTGMNFTYYTNAVYHNMTFPHAAPQAINALYQLARQQLFVPFSSSAVTGVSTLSSSATSETARAEEGRSRTATPISSTHSMATAAAFPPIPVARNAPMALGPFEQELVDASKVVMVGMFVILPFVLIPANTIRYVVREKEVGARHLQWLTGASMGAYWCSAFVFDFLCYLGSVILAYVVFLIFGRNEYYGPGMLGPSLCLFLFFGISSIPSSYVLSFFFTSPFKAQNIVLLINFVFGFLWVTMESVIGASALEFVRWATRFLRVIPSVSFGEGLYVVSGSNLARLMEPEYSIGSLFSLLHIEASSQSIFKGGVGTGLIYMGSVFCASILLLIILESLRMVRFSFFSLTAWKRCFCDECGEEEKELAPVAHFHPHSGTSNESGNPAGIRGGFLSSEKVTVYNNDDNEGSRRRESVLVLLRDPFVEEEGGMINGEEAGTRSNKGGNETTTTTTPPHGAPFPVSSFSCPCTTHCHPAEGRAAGAASSSDSPGMNGNHFSSDEAIVLQHVCKYYSRNSSTHSLKKKKEEAAEEEVGLTTQITGGMKVCREDLVSPLCPCPTAASTRSRRKAAVWDVSFRVRRGEVLALLGLNGAGKTTILRMLSGELQASSGEIFMNHTSIRSEASRPFIGYCPQFDALLDQLTAEEHLYLYARLRGVPESQIPDEVETTVEELGLGPHRYQTASALSGGNRRRLSLAIALIGNTTSVLLDEPTAGMDALARAQTCSAIQRLTMNKSVILTTHLLDEAEALAHRVAVLSRGEVATIGTVHEIRSHFCHDQEEMHIIRVDFPTTTILSASILQALESHILTTSSASPPPSLTTRRNRRLTDGEDDPDKKEAAFRANGGRNGEAAAEGDQHDSFAFSSAISSPPDATTTTVARLEKSNSRSHEGEGEEGHFRRCKIRRVLRSGVEVVLHGVKIDEVCAIVAELSENTIPGVPPIAYASVSQPSLENVLMAS